MKNSTYKKIIDIFIPILSILTIYLIFLLFYLIKKNNLIYPNPNDIIKEFFYLFTIISTYKAIAFTFLRLIICLLISFVIGFVLATLSYKNDFIKKYIEPFVLIFRTIPLVSIIVLLIIMFSAKTALYFIVCLMLIPVMYQNIYDGFNKINKEEVEAYSLESNFNLRILFYIYVPETLKDIKTALIECVGLGFKVLVMAEFISNTKDSLGYYINNSYRLNVDMTNLYAYTLILVILSILLTKFCNILNNKKKILPK